MLICDWQAGPRDRRDFRLCPSCQHDQSRAHRTASGGEGGVECGPTSHLVSDRFVHDILSLVPLVVEI